MRTQLRRGFTIIELITVMAISAILLGLITVPLVQSFNLTRTAQAFAEAQDRARIITDRIAREIGNAALVRGSGGTISTTLNSNAVSVPINTLIVRVPRAVGGKWPGNSGNPIEVALPYTKLDILKPAEGDVDTTLGAGVYVDPVTGKIDPTLLAPKGQVNLPAAPGRVMVRYFIALRDPLAKYNNPYDGLLMARNAAQDNLFALYRVEVVPYVYRAGKAGASNAAVVAYRPNLDFFDSDDATDSRIVDFDDPRFLLPNITAGGAIVTDDAKATRIQNWIKKAVLQTDASRFDMIMPVYDKGNRTVPAAANDAQAPKIVPLVEFRPSRINSDAASPMLAARPGEESDTSAQAGSDIYLTQYGLWGNATVRVYPQGWVGSDTTRNEYLVAHSQPNNADKPMSLYRYDPESNNNGPDFRNALTSEVFDIDLYNRLSAANGRYTTSRIYAFTQAVAAANANSGWLASAAARALFTPFTFDRNRGRIRTSFGIDEVGDVTVTPTGSDNLPSADTGLELTPATDTNLTGNFFDAAFSTLNKRFNKIYADYPWLRSGNVHRFIDLRVTPNNDGTPSPLDPRAGTNTATGFTYNTPDGGYRSKATIVPGSDVVIGPDQLPGSNYGDAVRYTRIARGEPGPNQYKLNYADAQEPTNATGTIDYTTLYPELSGTPLSTFNARTYNAQNLVSAVLQPRFKVGYLQLYSGADLPLPQGTVKVYYRFQFTGSRTGSARDRNAAGRLRLDTASTDVFTVDYDTRQLMDVLMTIRNFPQASVPNPQTVTLKATATVRNFTR